MRIKKNINLAIVDNVHKKKMRIRLAENECIPM